MSQPRTRRPLDRLFEALSHAHRRHALRAVNESTDGEGDRIAVDEIVPERADRDRVQIALTHVHLPKLADFGYVAWTRGDDGVRRGPKFAEVAPVLDLLDAYANELPGQWP